MSSHFPGFRPAKPFKVDSLIAKGDVSLINISYSWYKIHSSELIEGQNYLFGNSGILRYEGGAEFSVLLGFHLNGLYDLDEVCKQLGIKHVPYLSNAWSHELEKYGITPLPSVPVAIA